MNFGEMQRRVYAVLRDDQKEFIKPEEVEDWLNEAQNDLAQRLQHIRTKATGTVPSDGRIALPTGFVSVVSIKVDDSYFDASDDFIFHEENVGFRLFDGYIEVGKDNADLAYTLEYVVEPVDMNDHADTSTLPAELHYKIVNFARAHALYKERESEMADRYLEMYERGLPAHPLGVGKRIGGPLSLGYEKSLWDADGSHRG